jgi:serine/threonine-protein kinase HipA
MPVAPNEPYLFTDLPEVTYRRLPAMLGDALPDDFGNALINRYMAGQGIAAQDVTALDRLAYMSTRAMGAMTFRPARGPGPAQTHGHRTERLGRAGPSRGARDHG